MEQQQEKTIVKQTKLNIDLLGKFTLALRTNPDQKLSDFFNDWQESIHWDKQENYSIVNQGVILTHLYGLIVYPKAAFHNQIPVIKLDTTIIKEWGNFTFSSYPTNLGEFDIKNLGVESISSEEDMTLEFLIRKIRNAISHQGVTIDENMNFEFKDKDGTEICFNISGLQHFTEKYASCFMSGKWE